MKLLIIGASHGIGLETVREALRAGHQVTALARGPVELPAPRETLTAIRGDVLDPETVEGAVQGQEAVCLTLGAQVTLRRVAIFSEGTINVIRAMKAHSCRRLLCVTGIGAGESRGHGGFLYDRLVRPILLRTIYEDKNRQEAIVKASGLGWIIVRPGFLTNGPRTGNYRVLTDLTGVKAGWISRADVADFLIQEANEMRYQGQSVLLTC